MAARGTADYAEIRNTDLQVVQTNGFQVRGTTWLPSLQT